METDNSGGVWKFIKAIVLTAAMIVMGLVATLLALMGTCTMIGSAASRLTGQNWQVAVFGLVMEAIAASLIWGVYSMYKSQYGDRRK